MTSRAHRVVLVSCVKRKLAVAAAAECLYTSALFAGMRDYATRHADSWYVLSAQHGVLAPSDVIAPYERTLSSMPRAERLAWAERVNARLAQLVPEHAHIEILAGARYREDIVPFLVARGCTVVVPMAGLPLGLQLRWLKERR